eukprot:UN10576
MKVLRLILKNKLDTPSKIMISSTMDIQDVSVIDWSSLCIPSGNGIQIVDGDTNVGEFCSIVKKVDVELDLYEVKLDNGKYIKIPGKYFKVVQIPSVQSYGLGKFGKMLVIHGDNR